MNAVIQQYFGGKNGSGVFQQIINQIRPHNIYMELFAGSGAIFQYKKPAERNIIADLDPLVIEKFAGNTDIPDCTAVHTDAITYLKSFKFDPALRYCIYLDPPYPLSSRRSDRLVYRFEMTDQQHIELLTTVCRISQENSNVDFLISTYENEIYSEMLQGWNLHTFNAQTRAGVALEHLYMNYSNEDGVLHQFDYLGEDYIDRQRIKRKIERKVEQLRQLPAPERQAIISALLQSVENRQGFHGLPVF